MNVKTSSTNILTIITHHHKKKKKKTFDHMVIVFFLFLEGDSHPCSQSIEVNSLTPDGNGVISGQTIIKYVINRRTKTRGFVPPQDKYMDQVLDTQIPPFSISLLL